MFGILNVNDAEHYGEEIKRLKENDNYLKQLIYNQTLIQEITANVMRTSSAGALKQILYINKTVESIKDKDETGKTHLFNSLSLQTLTVMTSYKETQNAVIQLLTEVFHGKIPPAVITPDQLKQQLQTITKHSGNDLMVPGDDQRGQISHLYTMLSAKVSVIDESLIVKITVPLISREYYHLYHIVPVLFEYQNELQSIVPATSFMAANLEQDRFYMLSKEEKQTCKVPEKYIVKSESIEVTAKHVINGAISPLMLVPPVNIADNMPMRKSAPVNIKNWDEITNNAALDVLDQAIKQQGYNSSGHIDRHCVQFYIGGHCIRSYLGERDHHQRGVATSEVL